MCPFSPRIALVARPRRFDFDLSQYIRASRTTGRRRFVDHSWFSDPFSDLDDPKIGARRPRTRRLYRRHRRGGTRSRVQCEAKALAHLVRELRFFLTSHLHLENSNPDHLPVLQGIGGY